MFKLSILNIESATIVHQELVSAVVLPGEEGELAILDFHQPIVCCLKNGIIKISNRNMQIPIKGGIAKMEDNELSVLIEE